MKRANQIAVTTTPDLAGASITSYLGIVSSHIVTGTNVFRDLFGSLSDVFGGRSKSYRDALSAINDEAIIELCEKAARLGGDAVIGMSIDHDEISGGGKTMFMVTAIGTAVTLEEPLDQRSTDSAERTLSSDQMDRLIERSTIVAQIREERPTHLTKDTWRFIIENEVAEVADEIRQVAEGSLRDEENGGGGQRQARELFSEYLATIDAQTSVEILYKLLLSTNRHAAKYAHTVIEAFGWLDWERICTMLQSNDLEHHRTALNLLVYYKDGYSLDDITVLEELAALLDRSFPDRTKTVEQASGILSRAKVKWECPCGTSNSVENERCSKCLRDRRGLLVEDQDPNDVAEFLRDCRREIRQALA